MALAAAILLLAWKTIEQLALRLAPYDHGVAEGLFSPKRADVAAALTAGLLAALILGFAVPAALWIRRRQPDLTALALVASTGAFSAGLFMILYRTGGEGEWYGLDRIMTDPGSMPIYGQRLLFVWPAQALKQLAPALSYKQAFLLVQFAVITATLAAAALWSACWMPRRKVWLGQGLYVIALAPTFGYFNSYDLGIVLFYTLALWALYRRKHALFAGLVGIGALNHENTLLLVPLAAIVLYRESPRRRTLAVVFASLGLWAAARLAMEAFVPGAYGVHLRVLTNLWVLAHPNRSLVEAAAIYALWAVLALPGLRRADPFLRRAALLVFGLAAVTLVFGKFQEARQFDALIPVVAGLGLARLRHGAAARATPKAIRTRRRVA